MMEKILQKKLMRWFLILALTATTILGGALWFWGRQLVFREMGQVLEQEEKFYRNTQSLSEDKVSHYIRDYAEKLYGVDHLLNEYPALRSNGCLRSLCDFFDMDALYAFGPDGDILLSSREGAVGTRLLDVPCARPFAELMEQGGDLTFNFGCTAIVTGGEGLNFMAVPATDRGYTMLLMGIDEEEAAGLQGDAVMAGLMLQIPTTHDNAMFALDRKTGALLGVAEENSPHLSAKNVMSADSFLESLHGGDTERLILVNGVPTFLKTRMVDGIIFVDLRLASTLIWQVGRMFLGIVVLMLSILTVTLIVIRRYFRTYVFSEIDAIQRTTQRLMDGETEVSFQSYKDTELSNVLTLLNDWNNTNRFVQKKLNWIIQVTNPNAALFECLSYLKRPRFSDNLRAVLGMEQSKWDALKDDAEAFRAYIIGLDRSKNGDGIVAVDDRFLLLRLYNMEQDCFGIIVDKTDSVLWRERQADELRRAVDDSETDSLTGLLNRRGFEHHVGRRLGARSGYAAMLMMDVDNFKLINDNLGHPEGDVLLCKVADCLRAQFREAAVTARLGGDEFVVYLDSSVTAEELKAVLDRMIRGMRAALSDYADYDSTVSIGAACVNGGEATYEGLYQCADTALYQAKRAGKNRYQISVQ